MATVPAVLGSVTRDRDVEIVFAVIGEPTVGTVISLQTITAS